jgi:hypothetical protein
MKKFLNITAVAIAGAVLLSGCTGTKDATPTPTKTQAAVTNPISDEVIELGTATFSNGITVTVSQLGVGYATRDQTILWGKTTDGVAPEVVEATPEPESTEIPEALPVKGTDPITTGSELTPDTKVVAVRYEVANTSSEAINIKSFSARNGYYYPQPIEGGNAFYEASGTSLHTVLGVQSYPAAFDEASETWNLNSGETAVWALDWQIVTADLDKQTVILSQNFSLLGDLWSSDNKFELNLASSASD